MIGRPPCFSEEAAERVLEAVRLGLPYKQAARYGGVSYSTLNRWRQAGQCEDGPEHLREFWRQLEEANGEAALRLLGRIDEAAAEGDWKAASWILERRFPRMWGKNVDRHSDPLEPLFDTI